MIKYNDFKNKIKYLTNLLKIFIFIRKDKYGEKTYYTNYEGEQMVF